MIRNNNIADSLAAEAQGLKLKTPRKALGNLHNIKNSASKNISASAFKPKQAISMQLHSPRDEIKKNLEAMLVGSPNKNCFCGGKDRKTEEMLWGDALEWSDEVISAIVNQPLQFYEQPDEDNFDLRVPCPSPIAQTFPDDGLQIHPALFLPEWDVSFSNLSEEMPDCSILSEWEDSSEALKGVGSFDDSIF